MGLVVNEAIVKDLKTASDSFKEAAEFIDNVLEKYGDDGKSEDKLSKAFHEWRGKNGVSKEAGDEVLDIVMGSLL